MARKTARKIAREVDGWLYLFTGKRLKDVAPRAIHLLGEDLINSLTKNREPTKYDPNDPFSILGAKEDDSDLLVKAHYRDKAFKYHPDTGTNPDPQEFQRITEAYNTIIREKKRNG